jgi:aminoglycoside 6'-N-acetyltransferase I
MLTLLGEKDIEAAVVLFVDAFTNPPWNYDWMNMENAGRYIRDLYRTPGFLGFTHYDGDRLISVCLGCINDYFQNTQYEIKELAVAYEAQRKGVGSRVLGMLEEYLGMHRGVEFVTLQTAWLSPAYDFYRRNNYLMMEENSFLIKKI